MITADQKRLLIKFGKEGLDEDEARQLFYPELSKEEWLALVAEGKRLEEFRKQHG